MQRLRFGLSLDGERGWHARNSLGEATVGPLGFLTILETQLGLSRPTVSSAERTVQYRQCLAARLTAERFYAETFRVDELGTAATLLGWRDLWYLHGWDGSGPPAKSGRVRDLYEVEKLATTAVAPSVGQRLNATLEALNRRRPAIADVAKQVPDAGLASLTDVEHVVFNLVVKNLSKEQMAEMLGISTHTVRHHREHMMNKLDAHSVTELCMIASRVGMLG